MNYKEAYTLLKRKFPEFSAKTCAINGDLFMFNMTPDSIKPTQDGTGFYENMWSVNNQTGEIRQMSFWDSTDLILEADIVNLDDT